MKAGLLIILGDSGSRRTHYESISVDQAREDAGIGVAMVMA